MSGGAVSDLKVDFEVLKTSRTTLSKLKSDFDNIENRRHGTRNIWGHESVRDAMDEFASNMDHHREDLSKSIDAAGKKVDATIDTFEEADRKMKEQLEKDTSGLAAQSGDDS